MQQTKSFLLIKVYGFLYNIFSSLAGFFIVILGEFSPKIDRFNQQRKHGNTPKPCKKKYWIHCASFGEYEMAVPLIKNLCASTSIENIIITTFSPSGYKQATKGPYKDIVCYLPLDSPKSVRSFYKQYNPENAILIRYDFWYNFLKQGLKNNTKFYLVNGRFISNHFVLKWYGKPYKKLLKQFQKIFLSDRASAVTLSTHGLDNIETTGDTRYDRVVQTLETDKDFVDIERFKGDRMLLIVGSSWQGEEEIIRTLLEKKIDKLAIIIAPHDIFRSEALLNLYAKCKPKLYSDGNFNEEDKIIILDTIGMLSAIYKYADIAVVGGGFRGKLHNILEPAVWGCHISFGPMISKFPEAKDFVDAGFGTIIKNHQEWIRIVKKLTNSSSLMAEIKEKSRTFTKRHIGATNKVMAHIN
jgi:3-deoxy-D-manno-octulosonic-acid transferase